MRISFHLASRFPSGLVRNINEGEDYCRAVVGYKVLKIRRQAGEDFYIARWRSFGITLWPIFVKIQWTSRR